MSFEYFGDIVSILCTIVGLLYSVFKYGELHKRGIGFLVAFFLSNFLSEYYWTSYELITHSSPDVSEFIAYLGWNIGFLCLLFAVIFMRSDGAKKYFNPLMLIPVLVNIPQLILYCTFGGILNNIWEVSVTTLTEIFCLQEILFHFKNKDRKKHFPVFALFALLFMITTYGKWTSSCFDWNSDLLNPYLYFNVIGAVIGILLVRGAVKRYTGTTEITELKTAYELKFQVLVQTIATIIIVVGCSVGFITAAAIKNSLSADSGIIHEESQLAMYLFIISVILVLLILVLLYIVTVRYRHVVETDKKVGTEKTGRRNFIITTAITLVLMSFALVYNNTALYNASVVSMYEEGDEVTESTATKLENYLTVAVTTLRVTADSVDIMVANGESHQAIIDYLVDQTNRQFTQFDENFTGLYALIDGEYMDGTYWAPPEGYDPTSRDWYKVTSGANGDVVIVPPYVDAQTGSVVITIGKKLSSPSASGKPDNVVCLDVIVNYINEVSEDVNISGKGFGMIINSQGFIIAHQDKECVGQYLKDVYDENLLESITKTNIGRLSVKLNESDSSLFIYPVMDQWYAITVIEDTELFEDTYLQLTINVIVSILTFGLIFFFYYIGYKNEQIYGKKVEEMNIQIVTALAAAIDAKDNYTNGHSSRVAEYSKMIAAQCGYSKHDQDEIFMAGLLHDVGKIGVPDEVINKQAKLTDEEYEIIKKHPVIGNGILEGIKERPKLAIGARWHHERYDGKGYPDGLVGDNIPDVARIIAVADAYDAMTSKRSYRDVLPREKVIDEIKTCSGTQFDPVFADAMLKLIEEDTDYLMREKPANQ